jgi:hypothetical protein
MQGPTFSQRCYGAGFHKGRAEGVWIGTIATSLTVLGIWGVRKVISMVNAADEAKG